MRRMLCLALLLVACSELPPVPTVVERQPFHATADVWSGSSVTITSAAFTDAELPAVLFDHLPLELDRVDDTTLMASIPDAPGPHRLRIVAKNVDTASVIVFLRGFVGNIEGPFMSGRVESGRDPRYVFGSGPSSLRRWNIATNKAIDFGDSVHAVTCTRGVGPGPNVGDLVLLTGGCTTGSWMVWRAEPLTSPTDTTSVAVTDLVAVLRSDRWVVLDGGVFSVVACDLGPGGTCKSEAVPGLFASDVVRSPRGDRAALLGLPTGFGPQNGVTVVDVAGGTVGYRATMLSGVRAAAFTPDGDTLFLAGDSAGAPALAAVRAADGTRLATRALALSPCAVAVDGAQRWLFVAGLVKAPADTQSLLQVFDRATMNVVTTLHVTGAVGYGSNLCRIVQIPLERRVYVVATWAGEHNPAVHAQLFSFDTPR